MRPLPILAAALLAALLLALALAAARAQASPSPFTSGTRYDPMGRVTGTISADPDGPSGPLPFRATRSSYDGAGRPVRVETGTLAAWQSEAVAPAAWAGFAVERTLETAYDAMGRKVRDTLREGAAGAVRTVTQYSYDALGRPDCTALRMNPAMFAALPASACTPGAPGPDGPDRINRNIYDAAGQRLQLREGVATSDEAAEATWAYNFNGQVTAVIDGNGNRAELRYDGHGRQDRWTFPSPTRPAAYDDTSPASALATAGSVNPDDYEGYGYDANGNRTSLRLRSGETIASSYDALNRLTLLDNPLNGASVTDTDIAYSYDLLGHRTLAIDNNGHFVRNGYDALGRVISEESLNGGTKTIAYDAAGRRSRLTWADGFAVGYTYLDTGEVREIRENPQGASLLLAAFGYDGLGRRTSLTRGNGRVTVYDYDALSRLAYMGHHIGTFEPFSYFSYNAASQIASLTRTSDAMAFTAFANAIRADTINGLNQIASGGATHDARGNMTSDGTAAFGYDLSNHLVARSGVTQLYYDPSGRLTQQWNGGGVLDWVGDELVSETAGSNPRRYVHGPGVDDPLVWYENGARRYLHADERGSIVAITDDAGALLGINRYDEYGVPAATNIGRFQYTGQAWLPEIGRYYYKARIYWPDGGRFMQTDPVGYEDQFNLYAYVGNDPVNATDPGGREIVASSHRIGGVGPLHGKIVIIPRNQERWRDTSRFRAGGEAFGRRYITIGGGPDEGGLTNPGQLIGSINRPTDLDMSGNARNIILELPSGVTEDQMIDRLITGIENYGDNLDYDYFPSIGEDGYNSNSLAAGLLDAVGLDSSTFRDQIGGSKPVPRECFRPGGCPS